MSRDERDALEVRVRLTPRASSTQVALLEDGSLAVRVTAPAVEGRANEALVRSVAKALGLAPSRVTIVRGLRSRNKTLRLAGIAEHDLRRRLTAR